MFLKRSKDVEMSKIETIWVEKKCIWLYKLIESSLTEQNFEVIKQNFG